MPVLVLKGFRCKVLTALFILLKVPQGGSLQGFGVCLGFGGLGFCGSGLLGCVVRSRCCYSGGKHHDKHGHLHSASSLL